MDTTTLPLQEVAGTFDRPAVHHELAAGDIWIIAGDLLQAIQSRGTAKAGLSCDQQLHYFIPLASVAAGLYVPRRWARASVALSARIGCCCMSAGGAFAHYTISLPRHAPGYGRLHSPTKHLLQHTWTTCSSQPHTWL